MCYMILLSTDTGIDLAQYNNRLLSFSRNLPGMPEEALLTHQHKWFVASAHGCSCGFRHLYETSLDLGFRDPISGHREPADDIGATMSFIGVVRDVITRGAQVECLDIWMHGPDVGMPLATVEVNLAEITNAAFRFFQNHRFVFKAESTRAITAQPEGFLSSNAR